MLIENRWSAGRQIYWGVILCIIYNFALAFFYDASVTDLLVENVIMAIIILTIYLIATRSLKITTRIILPNNNLKLLGSLAIISFVMMMYFDKDFSNWIKVFNSSQLIYSLVFTISVATIQETIFRGFLLSGFLNHAALEGASYRFLRAAIYSSLLNAFPYFLSVFSGKFPNTLVDLLQVLAIAIFLATLRIGSNNLIWPILIHFFTTLAPFKSKTASSNNSLMVIIYLVILITSILYLIHLEEVSEATYKHHQN